MDVAIQQSVSFLGVASSTACQIFNEVIRGIVQVFYDEYVTLPTTEELNWMPSLKTGNFLACLGAWDGFHFYISSNLKKFFNFKKR